jgi:hypothetical protein
MPYASGIKRSVLMTKFGNAEKIELFDLLN